MIDFACTEFRLDEIIKCGLGLTKAEYQIFTFLVEHGDDAYTTDMLEKGLDLDRTTIQRTVKKLHERQVVERHQRNQEGGGYFYLYQSKPKPAIRKVFLDIVHNWMRTVETHLKEW
ncbi:MAG: helix-turn-helix domain-containing protein [Nanoarchaeota archaeon]